MHTTKVSVIVPTYNGATHLGAAIQSVLAQTYRNFELIVVNDASPDQTNEMVGQFDDLRLRYIVHEHNLGADLARHTGLQASSGEIIAFLDQDDLFHPDKLQAHVEVFEKRPDVGFTYNDRFELNYSAETIRDIWRAPRDISLADLVLWFPLSPSDVLLRRQWVLQMDLVGGSRGAEIAHFGRLFLAGCKFACVERALNYRRYHSGRLTRDLIGACESELNNQAKVFSDPRCPAGVLALRNVANANLYLYWAYRALAQQETATGQKFMRAALHLKPSIVDGTPCAVVNNVLINSIDDENLDHELLIHSVFEQLPPEMDQLTKQYDWAVARGFLLRGTRAIIWDRPEDGRRHFEQAASLGAAMDDSFMVDLTHHVLSYEAEFGSKAAQTVLYHLVPYLEHIGGKGFVRRLKSNLSFNRALQRYRAGKYAEVPPMILRAMAGNPKYLADRGALSVFVRAAFGGWGASS